MYSRSDAHNVAYTGEGLPLHQDLCYYESPPGYQLLQCARSNRNVWGGESTLGDLFKAAEVIRDRDREAFEALTKVPQTWCKQRGVGGDRGADMVYEDVVIRTHGITGEVITVRWAPMFEGVNVRYEGVDYEEFERAKKAFKDVLDEGTWKGRLGEGDCLVFNNRVMAHGRMPFEVLEGEEEEWEDGITRWMQGCYGGIDEGGMERRLDGNGGRGILGNGTRGL